MLRTTTRLSLAAAATFAVSLAPAAVAQAKQSCKPANSKTIVSNNYASVYGKNGKAYVCIKASGKTNRLGDASPFSDVFALGGKWVAYSSGPQDSVVTVMRIPDRYVDHYWYPFDTNMHVEGLVVKADGAAAWAATSTQDGSTLVQGTDRYHHPADQFSDDQKTVVTTSLRSLSGKTIGWSYSDGSSGTTSLF
jgi:hypothetical protein